MLAGYSPPRPKTVDELLGPELAAALDRLDLLSRKILSGKLPGERRSKRRGQSVEFDDFRTYTPGDDLRHIDWNVLARLDRLFVKVFRAEEDLALHLVVDASASMDVGDPNKLVYAHRLAMALGYVGLVNQNRVSLSIVGHAADANGVRQLAPLRGRPGVQRLGAYLLDSLAGAGGSTHSDASVVFASEMRRVALARAVRGIMVVVSDYLFNAEAGLNFLSPGSAQGTLDVYAVQVLSPGELDPAREAARALVGDLRMTDVETGRGAEVTVTPETIARYRSNLGEHVERLRRASFARGIAFVQVATQMPVDRLVLSTLRRGGLMR